MRKLQNITFVSGIQDELINIATTCLIEEKNHNSFQIDEMQIKPCIAYDQALKAYSGYIDEEFRDENNGKFVASHLLVFLLKCLSNDNKFIVAYYFTGNSIKAEAFWNVTKRIISKVESNGKILIHNVCTDMGPSNQAMWRFAKIKSTKEELISYCKHPTDTDKFNRSLFFIADPTHLVKNLRNILLNNNILFCIFRARIQS